MYELRSTFHRSLFLRVKLTIFHHWFRWWLGADQETSHYLNQWCLDYRRIYASLSLSELKNDACSYETTTYWGHIWSLILKATCEERSEHVTQYAWQRTAFYDTTMLSFRWGIYYWLQRTILMTKISSKWHFGFNAYIVAVNNCILLA